MKRGGRRSGGDDGGGNGDKTQPHLKNDQLITKGENGGGQKAWAWFSHYREKRGAKVFETRKMNNASLSRLEIPRPEKGKEKRLQRGMLIPVYQNRGPGSVRRALYH